MRCAAHALVVGSTLAGGAASATPASASRPRRRCQRRRHASPAAAGRRAARRRPSPVAQSRRASCSVQQGAGGPEGAAAVFKTITRWMPPNPGGRCNLATCRQQHKPPRHAAAPPCPPGVGRELLQLCVGQVAAHQVRHAVAAEVRFKRTAVQRHQLLELLVGWHLGGGGGRGRMGGVAWQGAHGTRLEARAGMGGAHAKPAREMCICSPQSPATHGNACETSPALSAGRTRAQPAPTSTPTPTHRVPVDVYGHARKQVAARRLAERLRLKLLAQLQVLVLSVRGKTGQQCVCLEPAASRRSARAVRPL